MHWVSVGVPVELCRKFGGSFGALALPVSVIHCSDFCEILHKKSLQITGLSVMAVKLCVIISIFVCFEG